MRYCIPSLALVAALFFSPLAFTPGAAAAPEKKDGDLESLGDEVGNQLDTILKLDHERGKGAKLPEQLPSYDDYGASTDSYGSYVGAGVYKQCLINIGFNADEAYNEAMLWQDQGGGAAADHCAAMALAQLGLYGDAAKRLNRLGADQTAGAAPLRAQIYGQAGLLWLLATNPQEAYGAFDQAIALAPGDDRYLAQYHFDRGRAALILGRWREAAADLTQAIALGRAFVDAFVLRAHAQRELGDLVSAGTDLDAALILKPRYAPAHLERGLVRRDTGDIAGARADFLLAAEIDGKGEIANEARQHLSALERTSLKSDCPEQAPLLRGSQASGAEVVCR